jgi:cell division inhibitor SepF
MSGFMKKTAVYLGLMEGEDPYGYDEYAEDEEGAVRPLDLEEGEDGEPEEPRFAAPPRSQAAAEERDPRPLFVSEPRRAREEERRDPGEGARPAPIALLAERTDRYERSSMLPSAPVGSAHNVDRISAERLGGGGGGGGGAGGHGDGYRITTLHPRTYNEARTIGEHFRDGTPVIMNLTEMGDPDAKRLVDFAAGLVFGLRGTIERVTQKVFLLSPANVDVTAEDKARIAEGGFFNQS